MTINVTRSCYAMGETQIPVLTKENVTPGEVIEFTDNNEEHPQELGKSYIYYCTASITDGDTTETSSEGESSSTLFGLKIDMPSDFEYLPIPGGGVTIKMTAPSTYNGTDPLPVPLTSMELYRLEGYASEPAEGAEPIQTLENPVAGEAVEFIDPNAVDNAKNRWYVKAFSSMGTGSKAFYTWLGYGSPSAVTNLVGVAEGKGVKLSWDAPTYSQDSYDGADFDPSMTRYKIYRTFGYNDETLIADDIAETTFTDTAEDLTEPLNLNYKVVPYNVAGEGSGTYPNNTYASALPFVIGDLYSLPFAENVTVDGKSDKLWTADKPSGATEWTFKNPYPVGNTYNPVATVEGYDNTGVMGVNYAYPYDYTSKPNVKSTITTYGINFTEVGAPKLRFYYYAIPSNDSKFDVIAIADGVETVLETIAVSDDASDTFAWSADNWRLKEYDLAEYAGAADFRIAFASYYEATKHNVMISKLSIVDDAPAAPSFVVDGVKYTLIDVVDTPDQAEGEAVNPKVVASAYVGTADTMTVPATVTYEETTYDVTAIDEAAFAGNSVIKDVTVEAPVIITGAFENCPALEKVAMSENTSTIAARAFAGCAALHRVEFLASPMPEVAADAFEGIHPDCTGKCPDAEYYNYIANEALSGIKFDLPSGIDNLLGNGSLVNVFSIEGVKVLRNADASALRSLAPGIYVVSNGEKTAKIVIR